MSSPLNDHGHKARTNGAVSELRAALWFSANGYTVFWPAIRNGPVDFVVETPTGQLLRVQCKTATWIASGKYKYLQARIRSNNGDVTAQSGHYDIVTVALGEELWVIPAKEIFSSNICLRGSKPDRPPEAWDNYKVA